MTEIEQLSGYGELSEYTFQIGILRQGWKMIPSIEIGAIGPLDILYASIFGGFFGAVVVLGLVALFQALSIVTRIKWTEESTRLGRIKELARVVPLYVYNETDWREVGHFLPKAAVIGGIVVPLVAIFAVGFVEIFL